MPTATSTAFQPHPSTQLPHSDAQSAEVSAPSSLPPGSTFDILPPALEAISQLVVTSGGPAGVSSGSTTAVVAPSTNPLHVSGSIRAGDTGSSSGDRAADLHELMMQARAKIQHARAVVAALPCIDLSIAQQLDEMGRVRARIGRLRAVWEDVRGESRAAAAALEAKGLGRGVGGVEIRGDLEQSGDGNDAVASTTERGYVRDTREGEALGDVKMDG